MELLFGIAIFGALGLLSVMGYMRSGGSARGRAEDRSVVRAPRHRALREDAV